MNYKNTLLFFISLTVSISASAQQWIDKKYDYDSLLNVAYGTAINFLGATDTLEMDIYTPICSNAEEISRRPLLIWIHGGAFLAGDKSEASITSLCKQFASRGYVTASINYRLGYISDDLARTCNYPNYACVFATDSSEWYRAYYRAVQDGKGALRYLVNRNDIFNIDTSNVFVAGESAGAIVSLGIGLLDDISEKPLQAYSIADAPKPHANALKCEYNLGKTFPNALIPRPDLGGINGLIEPSTVSYTIKGIGNMYGAMLSNLLKVHSDDTPKPSIFSFHQPCDLVVPIDSGAVYKGLSWCMANGYNCYGIANTAKLYGSRVISNWNTQNNYGYTIHNEFTATNFPNSFLIGAGSCADQVNKPCHAYDNADLRTNNLASFFALLVTTNSVCNPSLSILTVEQKQGFKIYPNPTGYLLNIEVKEIEEGKISVQNAQGKVLNETIFLSNKNLNIDLSDYPSGLYLISIQNTSGLIYTDRIVKE